MPERSLQEKLFAQVQRVLPQQLLSQLAGQLANSQQPWLKQLLINRFIAHFNVDMREALPSDPEKYRSFNDFFTRPLRAGSRPLQGDANTVSSPADGMLSEVGTAQRDTLLQAKGREYSLRALLGGDPQLAAQLEGGEYATIYLSPRDYHRVHMPLDGTLRQTIYVPGDLFSVNAATTAQVDGLFARNERLVCVFDTACGPVAVVLVGAMIVGSIATTFGGTVQRGGQRVCTVNTSPFELARGQELGRFMLGSTVIIVAPPNSVQWRKLLAPGVAIRMGESLGQLC